jgi:hypothetical protein
MNFQDSFVASYDKILNVQQVRLGYWVIAGFALDGFFNSLHWAKRKN